jgi:hypothetical protein
VRRDPRGRGRESAALRRFYRRHAGAAVPRRYRSGG